MEDETIKDSVPEEEDDKKKRSDDSNDGSSATTHHVSSAAIAQSLAVTFVALIVVSAVVIPAIENSANNVKVLIDGSLHGDELFVYVSVSPSVYDENYVVIIYEDGAEIYRQTLPEGYGDVHLIVNDYSTYKAEVRSGVPPLLVLGSKEILRT